MESRQLLAIVTVNSAADTGTPATLTLRDAIEIADGTLPISSLTLLQATHR